MIATSEIQDLMTSGATVVGTDGDKIGKLGQVFLDDQTGEPQWITVSTGFFGTSESFVPLDQASVNGDQVVVPFDKDKVKGAPRIDADGHLSEAEEDELYTYYGLGGTSAGYGTTDDLSTGTAGDAATGTAGYDNAGTAGYGTADLDAAGTVGHDTSGPTTDDAMTRSEERLNVGTERVATGRARLRKYIVTENQTVDVPVSREEVRLEREPITDGNVGDALSGPDLSEEEHEVVLTEERARVTKETVPVERVRLDKDVVTDTETVNETTRKEQIELEGDASTGTTGTGTTGTRGL